MVKVRGRILFAIVIGVLSFGAPSARTFAKNSPQLSSAKMVVTLAPIRAVTIPLPWAILPASGAERAPTYDFGPNLQAALAAKLVQTHFILRQPELVPRGPDPGSGRSYPGRFPRQWDGSSVVPAATFSFAVDALSLRTGTRGSRMFYGFDERLRTPFNDGLGTESDEFPLTVGQVWNWFDETFDDRGFPPFDSRSGLEFGREISLDAGIAAVAAQYEAYHAVIRMHVTMDAPLVGRHEVKSIQVKGRGLFFDIMGSYGKWSGAIGLARTDAMRAAFSNVFAATYSVIDAWSKTLPLTAKIFDFQSTSQIELNTGPGSNVPVGTKYAAVENPSLVFEVVESVPSGSLAKLESGTLGQIRIGMILVQQLPALLNARPSVPESIVIPDARLPKSDFAGNGFQLPGSSWRQVLTAVLDDVTFFYRLWRYSQYDARYLGPDSQLTRPSNEEPSPVAPQGTEDWAMGLRREPWAKQIGLDVAQPMTADGPLVAIIDSGVDYNHPALNERIWNNPHPTTDPDGKTDTNGWDFISGDSRPYDDGYHGTEVASTVIGVAPRAQIMPLKVFNPFGMTSSAAIYGAFQYAVDHGANLIVAAWATPRETKTLDWALRYAHDHGVPVVVAAGDSGTDLSKSASYPVVLSLKYDNVVAVTGVDLRDQLAKEGAVIASFDPRTVTIAAPGTKILVARPRGHRGRSTTTSVAAGLVAGALARDWADVAGAGSYREWIQTLRLQSRAVPSLSGYVSGGLVLRVK